MRCDSPSKRNEASTVLVLTGPARLTLQQGRIHIEDGFGNLQTRRTLELEFPLALKSIVLLTEGGTWSDHALQRITQSGAALYHLKLNGEITYSILPPGGTLKPALVRRLARLPDREQGLALARQLITAKIEEQEAVLHWLQRKDWRAGWTACGQTLALYAATSASAPDIESLRRVEARAAQVYFSQWVGFPVSFARVPKGQRLVPTHWQSFRSRESRLSGTNRDATDPINALLNFLYALLAAEIQIRCRAAGLEPSLGVLHEDKEGRLSLVYDLMEPLRPLADRFALEQVIHRTFRMNKDFLLLKEGVCRLGVEYARELAEQFVPRCRGRAEKQVQTVCKQLLADTRPAHRFSSNPSGMETLRSDGPPPPGRQEEESARSPGRRRPTSLREPPAETASPEAGRIAAQDQTDRLREPPAEIAVRMEAVRSKDRARNVIHREPTAETAVRMETAPDRSIPAQREAAPHPERPDERKGTGETEGGRRGKGGGGCQECGQPLWSQWSQYCPACRKERRAAWTKARWKDWREEGRDPTHGGEAARKRGEAIARSNRLKPRKRREAPDGRPP